MNIEASFGNWLAGFTDGEGCFGILICEKQRGCTFQLCMRGDDEEIISLIRNAIGVGHIYHQIRLGHSKDDFPTGSAVSLQIFKASDLSDVIVPLFTQFPLRSRKKHEFDVWKQAVELLANTRRSRSDETDGRLLDLRHQLDKLKAR